MVSFIKNFVSYPDGLEVWQVAIILRLGQDTVRRLIRTHRLPAYRVGRAYLISKYDLRKFIEGTSTNEDSSEGCDGNGV